MIKIDLSMSEIAQRVCFFILESKSLQRLCEINARLIIYMYDFKLIYERCLYLY